LRVFKKHFQTIIFALQVLATTIPTVSVLNCYMRKSLMITILLVEDNKKDAESISALLDSSLSKHYAFTLIHKSDTAEVLTYLSNSSPDLILMDLEMKEEHQTTMGIIEQIPRNIPIIVISHLSHYQKPSLRHGNVFDFVPKSKMSDRLINRILQVLSHQNSTEPPNIIFPAVVIGDVT